MVASVPASSRPAPGPRVPNIDRFEIRGRLGGGAMGVVYDAFDHERGHRVALKQLRALSASSLYNFKREFRELADQSHPNLVRLYELLSFEDEWFLTMEIIDGTDFLSYVRGTIPGPPSSETASAKSIPRQHTKATMTLTQPPVTDRTGFSGGLAEVSDEDAAPMADIPRLRRALQQLVGAVGWLHQRGLLHRDLKPGNVLVDQKGRVVLIDFGILCEVASGPANAAFEGVAGTPAYMAPEQLVHGKTATPASDWYAVGTLLYEAISGRRPFVGTVAQMVEAKAVYQPRPPLELRPEVPEDLSKMAVELLVADPEQRLSGRALMGRVRPTRASSQPLADTAEQTRLVGRERQLTQLTDAFTDAKTLGRSIFVAGRSGMGKSALIDTFLGSQDVGSETLIFAGRCYEAESVPHKALDSVVDSLCRVLSRLRDSLVTEVVPKGIAALVRIFPVLDNVRQFAGRRIADAGPRGINPELDADPLELRETAFRALRELLEALAARQTVIFYIDDLQWGDIDCASFLEDILRRPVPGLLFMAAFRHEEAASSQLLERLFRISQDADASTINVTRLPLEQALELVQFRLGDQSLEPGVLERLARESGGNPYFVDELCRFARSQDRGVIMAASSASLSLANVIGTRYESLPIAARRLLMVIAVAGRPIPLRVARAAALSYGESQESTIDPLAVLRGGNLVRTSGVRRDDLVESIHDRVRQTVVESLDEEVLAQAHHALALTLSGAQNPDAEALALHFHCAGQPERAFEYAVRAAELAWISLAFERAATLFEQAAAIGPGQGSEHAGLLERRALALTYAGRVVVAADSYTEAAQHVDGIEHLRLTNLAAACYLRGGELESGLATLDLALKSINMKLARSHKTALASFLWLRLRVGLRGLKFRETNEAQLAPAKLARVDVCWSVAEMLSIGDKIRGAEFQTRHLLMALKLGEPGRVAQALAVEGAYASVNGPRSRRRATKVLASADELAVRIGSPHLRALVDMSQTLLAYQSSEWKRCAEISDATALHMRKNCRAMEWEAASVQLWGLWSRLQLGELGQVVRRIPELTHAAERRHDQYAITLLSGGATAVAFVLSEGVEAAIHRATEAVDRWTRKDFHLQHYWEMYAIAEAHLFAGEGERALKVVEDSWAGLRGSFLLTMPLVRSEALHLRSRAALCSWDGTEPDRSELAGQERIARKISAVKEPWCPGRALLIRAAVAQRRGNDDDAREHLRAAYESFAGFDANLYAAAAQWRLGQLTGGDEGAGLLAGALEPIAGLSISEAEAVLGMIAPGFTL